MNRADSERIAGQLEKLGYKEAKTDKQADLVVVTTCGVRQSAEDKAYGLIAKIKKQKPKTKIILSGCLSERADVRRRLKNVVDVWLPAHEILNFKFKILNELQITNYKFQKNDVNSRRPDSRFPIPNSKNPGNCKYLNISPKYNSKFSAYVPIGNGCNNFCAYCVVPYARGREVYRPAEEIIAEVKDLVKKGYKEITLIAQNVNSYRSKFSIFNFQFSNNFQLPNSKTINFAQLLKIVNQIPGDFWIRFATSHPKDMSDELIKTIGECAKVCEHVHLPAQAGDNVVLKNMNRKYTREDYLKLIKKIKLAIPKRVADRQKLIVNSQLSNVWSPAVSITTDIIVGFPGETKAQFNNTAKLFKEVKFDMAYIAQYSPRPGTVAEKMDNNVPKPEKKRREEELMKILRKTALANNQEYLGKTVEILVDGKSKSGEWLGKTRTFKVVAIKKSKKINLLGKFIRVKIISVKDFGMEGEII